MTEDTKQLIQDLIENNDIVLFMKGTKLMPMCGFSGATVQCLEQVGAKYETFNVLEDQEVREGIKEFSNWPTIPQLYIKKEFIGGCDIVRELYETGELEALVK